MKCEEVSTKLRTISSLISIFLFLICFHRTAFAQEPTTKIRISKSALSVTALPLLAAREWSLFREQKVGQ